MGLSPTLRLPKAAYFMCAESGSGLRPKTPPPFEYPQGTRKAGENFQSLPRFGGGATHNDPRGLTHPAERSF